MARKKDVEAQLAECERKRAALKVEVHELRAEIKATHALLVQAQKLQGAKAAELEFDALCSVLSAKIDAEIQAAGKAPARQWSLVTMRKELDALGR